MTIIFEQYDDATRTKIALDRSYEADHEAGKLIKLLLRVHKVYNGSNNGGLLFGAYVAEIAKHNLRLVRSVEELLAAHPIDDDIWDYTDPCDVSIDTTDNAEIIASSHTIE